MASQGLVLVCVLPQGMLLRNSPPFSDVSRLRFFLVLCCCWYVEYCEGIREPRRVGSVFIYIELITLIDFLIF